MGKWIIGSVLLVVALITACTPRSGAIEKPEANTKAAPRVAVASSAKKPSMSSWPIFRGDSHATGVANSTLPKKPELVWKFEVERGAFEGTAAIVGGVAYIGDLDGTVYAFELKTGNKKWETNFSNKAWTFPDGKPVGKEDKTEISGFMASPSYRDGRLYIGDMFGRFFCLDAQDGKPLWGYEAQAEIDAGSNFYKGNILFGSQDATLYCLNAKNGKEIWKHQIEDQIRCSPTIVGDRTFVAGCDSRLHIIDLVKGKAVDGVDIESPTMVTPAVLGDNIYFGTEGGVLFCINWKDAKTEWTYADPERSQSMRSSPAITKTHVIFGGRSKRLYALDPTTGKELWTFAAKGGIDSSPVIVGDRVFVGSSDGRIYGLTVAKGEKVWEYEAGGDFTASPAVADGYLVIASNRGTVYCFGERKK